eukprot:TRINITY_DN19983_c0_g2_i1.p1 TRINITY_DN19983_c0_g2~~TRINITY_DN19983_c0_g2_i1.p1  ORF type:complete len:607 (+),score=33.88 TRINITY_DN19983_c0_g2_i1:43-1821(+)
MLKFSLLSLAVTRGGSYRTVTDSPREHETTLTIVLFAHVYGADPHGAQLWKSANLMAERINNPPGGLERILPGIHLDIRLEDVACSPDASPERLPKNRVENALSGTEDVFDVSGVKDAAAFDDRMIGHWIGDEDVAQIFNTHDVVTRKNKINRSSFFATLGYWCPRTSRPAVRSLANARKPLISLCSRDAMLTNRNDYPYVFRLTTPKKFEMEVYGHMTHLIDKDIEKVSILTSSWASASHESLVSAVERFQFKTVGQHIQDGLHSYAFDSWGLPLWKSAKAAADAYSKDPTKVVWARLNALQLDVFLCALSLKGFTEDSARPIFITSSTGASTVHHVINVEDLEKSACNLSSTTETCAECDELKSCNASQMAGLLEGILLVGSGQVTNEDRQDIMHVCAGEHLHKFAATLVEEVGRSVHTPYIYNIADAVCMYALAIRAAGMHTNAQRNFNDMSASDFMQLERALAATDFDGLIGRIKYVSQDGTDKRYIASGSASESALAGPDLHLIHYVDQYSKIDGNGSCKKTRIATYERHADGEMKVDIPKGSRLVVPSWSVEKSHAGICVGSGLVRAFLLCCFTLIYPIFRHSDMS